MKYFGLFVLLTALQVLLHPNLADAAGNELQLGKFECSPQCSSKGECVAENTCKCSKGFVGAQCQDCEKGHYGPECISCQDKCNTKGNKKSHFKCFDGITGVGLCHCEPGYHGEECDKCTQGYNEGTLNGKFTCIVQKKCGNGIRLADGTCQCLAGWALSSDRTECSVTKCADGYFFNQEGECKSCPTGCKKCTLPEGAVNPYCEKCDQGYIANTDGSGTCTQEKCLEVKTGRRDKELHKYLDGTVCKACHKDCSACSGPEDNQCVTCQNGFYYIEGKCVRSNTDQQCELPDDHRGFLANEVTKRCEPCKKDSIQCHIGQDDKYARKVCMPGELVFDGECVLTCPDRHFVHPGDGIDCIPCSGACSQCTGPKKNQCLACRAPNDIQAEDEKEIHQVLQKPRVVHNGVCQGSEKTCPTQTYPAVWVGNSTTTYFVGSAAHVDQVWDSTMEMLEGRKYSDVLIDVKNKKLVPNLCKPCHPDCQECSGHAIDQCTQCSSQRILMEKNDTPGQGQCVKECPRGYIVDPDTRKCKKVPEVDEAEIARKAQEAKEEHDRIAEEERRKAREAQIAAAEMIRLEEIAAKIAREAEQKSKEQETEVRRNAQAAGVAAAAVAAEKMRLKEQEIEARRNAQEAGSAAAEVAAEKMRLKEQEIEARRKSQEAGSAAAAVAAKKIRLKEIADEKKQKEQEIEARRRAQNAGSAAAAVATEKIRLAEKKKEEDEQHEAQEKARKEQAAAEETNRLAEKKKEEDEQQEAQEKARKEQAAAEETNRLAEMKKEEDEQQEAQEKAQKEQAAAEETNRLAAQTQTQAQAQAQAEAEAVAEKNRLELEVEQKRLDKEKADNDELLLEKDREVKKEHAEKEKEKMELEKKRQAKKQERKSQKSEKQRTKEKEEAKRRDSEPNSTPPPTPPPTNPDHVIVKPPVEDDSLPTWSIVLIIVFVVFVIIIIGMLILRRYNRFARKSSQVKWMVNWMTMKEENSRATTRGEKRRSIWAKSWAWSPSEKSSTRMASTESESTMNVPYGPVDGTYPASSAYGDHKGQQSDLDQPRAPEQIADPRLQRTRNQFH